MSLSLMYPRQYNKSNLVHGKIESQEFDVIMIEIL